jgi:hypothetical protein
MGITRCLRFSRRTPLDVGRGLIIVVPTEDDQRSKVHTEGESH